MQRPVITSSMAYLLHSSYQSLDLLYLEHNNPTKMEKLGGNASQALDLLLKPASWIANTLQSQADFLTNAHRSSSGADASPTGVVLKRIGHGLIGAAYTCMVLTGLLVAAVAVGVGTVRIWVDEPVVVRENLHFDYTQFHPEAFFSFAGEKTRFHGVPVGHTNYVSVVLLLPESHYNRHIGVFQLTAEVLSADGTLVRRSSHPCMLQFRSLPIRLARTFLMGVPLLLGTTLEAQKLTVNILKYREAGKNNPRTGSIRITLNPRAGSMDLPELYESQILIQSQLPWSKELVRSWKWTFYVWTSLYSYIILLTLVLCCFRHLVFLGGGGRVTAAGYMRVVEETNAETLRKWQHYRRKRKAEVLGQVQPEESDVAGAESSATSFTLTREEEEDVADSSSVCQ